MKTDYSPLRNANSSIRTSPSRRSKGTKSIALKELVLILGLGVVLGLAFNTASPSRVPLIPHSWSDPPIPKIDARSAKIRQEAGAALIVDARPADTYRQEHIPNAVNLPLEVFDFTYAMKFGKLDPEKELIVYGRNISMLYDESVAFKLREIGHTNVRVLSGGLSEWTEKGYPIEP